MKKVMLVICLTVVTMLWVVGSVLAFKRGYFVGVLYFLSVFFSAVSFLIFFSLLEMIEEQKRKRMEKRIRDELIKISTFYMSPD